MRAAAPARVDSINAVATDNAAPIDRLNQSKKCNSNFKTTKKSCFYVGRIPDFDGYASLIKGGFFFKKKITNDYSQTIKIQYYY